MNDIRRFFRYVVPGLIFTLQIVIYLSISLCPSQFSQTIGRLNNVGSALSIFLLSGGLGFLLSTIYHTLYWTQKCAWMDRLRVDHRPLINSAIKAGSLCLCDHDGKEMSKIKNQKAAWRIATAFWNVHKDKEE